MSDSPTGFQPTDDEVALVVQAIRGGRVRGLDGALYDPNPKVWNEEAVRDWLERTHTPRRAREIVRILRGGGNIKSRPAASTVYIALQTLTRRVEQLEREVAALREQSSSRV
jgi:hypothetical protein